MKRFFSILQAVVLLCGISLCGLACAANSSPKPNILLILTDDLGNNDLASWGDGKAPTPTLDELSRQSVRFRQHYTDSTCSPSRAALLTGRQPVSVGFQTNGVGLSSDLDTLPKSLKKLGYRTIHIGKWHVGEALEYPEIQPGNQGFDYWLGFLNHFVLRGPNPEGNLLPRSKALSVPTHMNPWLQENGGELKQYSGYLDDILTDKAIEKMTTEHQPWFINLWLFAPHTPYQPSPKFAHEFPDTPDGRFKSILKHLDFNVKELLDALERKGLADNTIVIFASDNGGPNISRDNNFPLVGKKIEYRDGGIRSPLLLLWPHHFKNSDITSATHITDIFPTLIHLAGGKPPAGIMGRDLGPLLEGEVLGGRKVFSWIADTGPGSVTYGEHYLDGGGFFYRDLMGGYETGLTHQPIGDAKASGVMGHQSLSAEDARRSITVFERMTRTPAFKWQPKGQGHAAKLSGLDFQRAPLLGGYSIGFSLEMTDSASVVQTILEQAGVWRIDWLADRRIRIRVGEEEQFSAPITQFSTNCSKLVVTTFIKPASSFPFPGPAMSNLSVYWNDELVLQSDRVLSRPASALPLKNPTWIGNSADGKYPILGEVLGKPIVINKFLLPEQEGYKLGDLQSVLCRSSDEKSVEP